MRINICKALDAPGSHWRWLRRDQTSRERLREISGTSEAKLLSIIMEELVGPSKSAWEGVEKNARRLLRGLLTASTLMDVRSVVNSYNEAKALERIIGQGWSRVLRDAIKDEDLTNEWETKHKELRDCLEDCDLPPELSVCFFEMEKNPLPMAISF